MNKWQINKKGLITAYWDKPMDESYWAYIPDKIFESPKGRLAVFIYGLEEINNLIYFANFMIFRNPFDPEILLKTDYTRNYCWLTDDKNTISWSKDEKYVSITVVPIMKNYRGYYEAKLIVNTEDYIFTLIPLAGATDYHLEFLSKGRCEIYRIVKPTDAIYYDVIPQKTTYLSNIRRVHLKDFSQANKLFASGYFGDISGYKRKESNIHFKQGYAAWPYNK